MNHALVIIPFFFDYLTMMLRQNRGGICQPPLNE